MVRFTHPEVEGGGGVPAGGGGAEVEGPPSVPEPQGGPGPCPPASQGPPGAPRTPLLRGEAQLPHPVPQLVRARGHGGGALRLGHHPRQALLSPLLTCSPQHTSGTKQMLDQFMLFILPLSAEV